MGTPRQPELIFLIPRQQKATPHKSPLKSKTMKPGKYLSIIIAMAVIVITGFKAIEDPIKKLIASLATYNAIYPTDKVYLQFDKPFYKPGEDIWVNAFVLNGNTHLPSTTSDVLYVELIDPKGNVF